MHGADPAAAFKEARAAAVAAAEEFDQAGNADAPAVASLSSSEANSAANSPPSTPLPDWITILRNRLLNKFPHDSFEIIQRAVGEFRIKCHDCPGKLYTPGPGNTLENFEIHLNNRHHRSAVEQRTAVHGGA
ncbi:hypothetical protein BC936DRAFT_138397 [Jimgerdemannia flammicorona]|nr:hypothetical protein BC936DRAFT_138397 [Jimgerdemannia flammicorona]